MSLFLIISAALLSIAVMSSTSTAAPSKKPNSSPFAFSPINEVIKEFIPSKVRTVYQTGNQLKTPQGYTVKRYNSTIYSGPCYSLYSTITYYSMQNDTIEITLQKAPLPPRKECYPNHFLWNDIPGVMVIYTNGTSNEFVTRLPFVLNVSDRDSPGVVFSKILKHTPFQRDDAFIVSTNVFDPALAAVRIGADNVMQQSEPLLPLTPTEKTGKDIALLTHKGAPLYAHSKLLSEASDFFLYYHYEKYEGMKAATFPDFDARTLASALEYIYTGRVVHHEPTKWISLYHLSGVLGLDQLGGIALAGIFRSAIQKNEKIFMEECFGPYSSFFLLGTELNEALPSSYKQLAT